MIKVLIAIILAVVLIHPVFAVENSTGAATRKEKIQQRIAPKPNVESKKEMLQWEKAAVKEKIATREAALKARLEKFKDKRKAEIAERVSTNLGKINQKQTSQMLKHLDKMSTLLDKLEARVNKSTQDIKDPAAVKAAIAETRSKIASATAAVKSQSEKDYTLTVSTENKVRADAQALRNQLHADLQAVRKQVVEAKQSVANAIRVAKSGKESASSGQQ